MGPGQGEWVLVVDDEPAVRAVVCAALRNGGYRTLAAAGGAEAVAVLAERGGDVRLAVVDVHMPGMDGPQTMSALRQLRPDLPLLAVSGMDAIDFAQAGVVPPPAFLHKPFTTAQLVAAVAHALAPG